MTTKPTTLHYFYSKQPLTLQAAIDSGKKHLEKAIALLYSPEACHIAKLSQGQLTDSSDHQITKLENIFEARIFNQNCELRWLNQAVNQGQAVFLSESQLNLDNFKEKPQPYTEALDQQYLLWGEVTNSSPKATNWQRLAEARIGKLNLPFDQTLQNNQRLCLKTLEYLAESDEFGNFSVIEERLIKLLKLEAT